MTLYCLLMLNNCIVSFIPAIFESFAGRTEPIVKAVLHHAGRLFCFYSHDPLIFAHYCLPV